MDETIHHSGDTPDAPKPTTDERGPRRRSILKALLGAGAVAAIGTGTMEWTDSTVSTALLAPDPEKISEKIPPELIGMDIPRSNEHYKEKPLEVFLASLNAYEDEGGRPFYRRPTDYLTQDQAVGDTAKRLFQSGSIKLGRNDAPPLMSFSSDSYSHVDNLRKIDPGSSAMGETDYRLNALGSHFKESLAGNIGTSKADGVVADVYMKHFNEARDYINNKRGTEKVSTSELCTYFLRKNSGDITQSLIDTTMFLKMAARVDR